MTGSGPATLRIPKHNATIWMPVSPYDVLVRELSIGMLLHVHEKYLSHKSLCNRYISTKGLDVSRRATKGRDPTLPDVLS